MNNLASLNSLIGLVKGRRMSLDYWLFDNFTTARAAGALDGTSAEPIGGNRSVLDGNNVLSITGNKLNFATGGVANFDPTLTYSTTGYARTPGRMLIGKINVTGGRLQAGWNSTTAKVAATIQAGRQGGVDFNGGTLAYVNGSTASISVGSYSTGTEYTFYIIQRAAGTMLLIKGGAFTYPKLVRVNSAESAATLYPYISALSTNGVGTVDDIRVYTGLWLATPLLSDGFGSTFGTSDGLGHAEGVAGGLGAGGAGLTWSPTATWSTSAGKLVNNPNLGSDVVVNGTFASDTAWTKGTGWTITGGTAVATAASGTLSAVTPPLTLHTWYQTTYTLGSLTAGWTQLVVGSTGNPTRSANGTYIETQRAITTTGLTFNAFSSFTATIDNVICKPLTTSELITTVSTSSSNVQVMADVTFLNGTHAGVAANVDSDTNPQNFVIAYLMGAILRVDKCVSGVYTNILSTGVTYSAGAKLELRKSGTSYWVYYNNAQVGSTLTVSDSSIVNNTRHGVFNTDNRNTLDNAVVYAEGDEAQYVVLNSF